ncbi:hypothetical protein Vretifemale_13755 [Volvox reticuliferus]|uniref:EF-hand domain-containing protein n=1 Tax=Volvox reticuliferus TaxID=1737510 RepID=A0A8J4CTX6_9CHLO|nr:hypothetical protein Vretifemale_13755 [Volvox reticuliferus]
MAALKVTQQPDPERLQALADEYRAEVAAYVQSLTGPGAPGTDVFTLMRARIRAEPGLLPSEFNKLDNDKDGSLSPAQVHDLIPHLLPEEVHCSEQLSKYISAMLTLGSGEMMTQGHIVLTLKACRSAYKEAASMVHMLQDGSIDWYQVAQEDGLGVEMALCRLAEQLVQPTNVQAAQEAFQLYDTDGSGYLDIGLEVPPNEVTQLQQLISLDSGKQSLSVMELISDIVLSADAIKRAMSINRYVQKTHTNKYCLSCSC